MQFVSCNRETVSICPSECSLLEPYKRFRLLSTNLSPFLVMIPHNLAEFFIVSKKPSPSSQDGGIMSFTMPVTAFLPELQSSQIQFKSQYCCRQVGLTGRQDPSGALVLGLGVGPHGKHRPWPLSR